MIRSGRIALWMTLLAAPALVAQSTGVSCTTSTTASTVRAGGVNEQTSDLLLTCTGGFPYGDEGVLPMMQISVNMSPSASGRLLNAPWSEALLLIDEPAPGSQLVCAAANGVCPMIGNYDATYDGSQGHFNVFQAQRNGSSYVWPMVPFDPPGAQRTRTLRFTNLKVDAGSLTFGFVTATVSFAGQIPVQIASPTRTVANVQSPLALGSPTAQGAGGQLTGFALSLLEGFPSVFKTRSTAGTGPADENEPGIINLGSETGFRNSAFPSIAQRGNLANAGLADTGTRLAVILNNIPATMTVDVPLVLGNNVARRVITDTSGAGVYTPATSTTLTNTNGVVAAIYEIVTANPNQIETLAPSFTFTPAAGAPTAALPQVKGNVMFVPLVTPNSSPQPAYSLNTVYPFEVNAPTGPALSITTTSLPDGFLQVPYSQALKATGGTSPYTFAVPAANTLPPGLAISNGGTIAGTPTRTGKFTFTAVVTDANRATASRELTINVSSAPPPVSASPRSIDVTAPANGEPPPVKSIKVLAGDSSATPFRVRIDGGEGRTAPSWLSASPPKGTTPARLLVAIDQNGLAPGQYSGRIVITDLSGTVVLDTIDVRLEVTTQNPKLRALPSILKLQSRAGQPEKRREYVLLGNAGGGTSIPVKLSIKRRSPWITGVTPTETTVPGSPPRLIAIDIDTTGLAEGFYRDVLRAEWSGTPVEVPIVLWVAPNAPLLDLSDHGLLFYSRQGERNPIVKRVRVLNKFANTTVQWKADVILGADWLGIAATSGQATKDEPATIRFTLRPAVADLPAGRRYALVRVSDEGAIHSPQYVVVVLQIALPSDPPLLDFNPGGLLLTAAAGGGRVSRDAEIRTTSTALLPFNLSASTQDGENWLSVTPASGSINADATAAQGSLTVVADPAGLAPGIYRGQVVGYAGGQLYALNVGFIVTPADVNGATAEKPVQERQASCSPKKLALVQSALVDNFAVPAGWPASLSVELRNDCGAAVANGAVVASFSNGDPPLSLDSEGNSGSYSATWQPGITTPEMNVTIRAVAAGLEDATAALVGTVSDNAPPTLFPNGTIHINYHPVELGGPLAPGQPAEVYGTALASVVSPTDQLPLTTSYKGTSVLVGPYDAPLFFVSPGQVNIQLPTQLLPNRRYSVLAIANGEPTQPIDIDIVALKPGVTNTRNDAQELIAQHVPSFALVTPQNPAKRGEALVMYLVGLGATNPPVATGAPSPVPVAVPQKAVQLTIDGIPATVLGVAMTPGGVGLAQIAFQVPDNVPLNKPLDVVVTQDGVPSNTTRLVVAQ